MMSDRHDTIAEFTNCKWGEKEDLSRFYNPDRQRIHEIQQEYYVSLLHFMFGKEHTIDIPHEEVTDEEPKLLNP